MASDTMSALSTSTDLRVSGPTRISAETGSLLVRPVVLAALFSAAAIYEAGKLFALTTPEIWLHLRTGLWILAHRAIPHTGLFSQYSNLPWTDVTWGFDVLLAATYHLFGLRSVPILLMAMKVALAVATFLLARVECGNFWKAIALSAVAQFVISSVQPLPYVFSIVFLAAELWLLLRSRQTGKTKSLFWLPVLFGLWANVHVQFVSGLLLLILFMISLLLEAGLRKTRMGWLSERIQPLDLRQVGTVSLLSVLASFVNPYTFRIWSVFKSLYSSVGFEHFTEMTSMSFRRPQQFALMLLVMIAFLSLGRRRRLELFELLALLAGTLIAFRIERDGWMVVLPAIAVLSEGFRLLPGENAYTRGEKLGWDLPLTAALTVIAVGVAAVFVPRPNVLMSRVGEYFPVKACDYIAANHLPQPIFNTYSWGSFLTWYMPQYPVAVDSRVELYGDETLSNYFDIVGGKELLESQPMVARARVLLLEKDSAISKALVNLPGLKAQYSLVYEDDISGVFVPRGNAP